jgi:translation initiation factor RLI1
MLFNQKLKGSWQTPLFKTEVLLPLQINTLLDNEV